MVMWRKAPSESESEVESINNQISEYILKLLKAGAIAEKKLIIQVYNQYNEILPQSVMIRLKALGKIQINNGMWSIRLREIKNANK
jgi:hypothetical protein